MKKPFYLAISLLTRLPVPSLQEKPTASDFGYSALYYPVIGLLLGGLLSIPAWLFPNAEPVLLAAIIVVFWAVLSGGLHLDGLADSADAWLGGMGDIEKTKKILKDYAIGTAGVAALAGIFLLKFAALLVLLEQQLFWVLLFAPCLGRVAILLVLLSTPYISKGGLGDDIARNLPKKWAFLWVATSLLASALLSWPACLLFVGGIWLLRRLMLQRLQGCNGDTLGASVEIGEALWLLGVGLALSL